jgi:predicted peptidase
MLKDLPIWAFHGGKDPVVPVEESKEIVEAINRRGGNAKLTIYPDAKHDSWTETYNNQELYDWLLEHRRVDKK